MMNKNQHNKPNRTKSHYSIESKKPNYNKRRAGVALAGLALLAGGAKMTAEATEQKVNHLMVDPAVVADMKPEEIDQKFDKVSLPVGGNIYSFSSEYAKENGLNVTDVRETLTVQARQHDIAEGNPMNAHEVRPDEVFYIPRDQGNK